MKSILVAAFIAALALSGCSTPEETFVTPDTDDQGRYVIEMTSRFQYEPKLAEVPAGATVVWKNAGGGGHDVESATNAWSASPMLTQGEEYAITAPTTAGDYEYWCNPHKISNNMVGTLRVVAQ